MPIYITFSCVLIPLINRSVNVNGRFFINIKIPSLTLWTVTHDPRTTRINNAYPRMEN